MKSRQAAALLLSTDLRAVLADVETALDLLYEYEPSSVAISNLLSAYVALAGRSYRRKR